MSWDPQRLLEPGLPPDAQVAGSLLLQVLHIRVLSCGWDEHGRTLTMVDLAEVARRLRAAYQMPDEGVGAAIGQAMDELTRAGVVQVSAANSPSVRWALTPEWVARALVAGTPTAAWFSAEHRDGLRRLIADRLEVAVAADADGTARLLARCHCPQVRRPAVDRVCAGLPAGPAARLLAAWEPDPGRTPEQLRALLTGVLTATG